MMSGNESKRSGASPEDAPACGVSVQDSSVLDASVRGRMNWIDERVNDARSCCNGQFLARAILPIVEEFADLLRIHFAGGE